MPTVQEIIKSMQNFGMPDYTIFAAMLVMCGIVGIYFGFVKKSSGEDEYLVGGRNMSTFPVSLSLLASFISEDVSIVLIYNKRRKNPALEWNKLGNGSSLDPYFSTSPVLTKFDLCLIIAPAVTFKGDTIVCGSAVEVNYITDIELTINLDQIKLISTREKIFIYDHI
ncbi:uncharacterized protein LOC112456989 [Temnothorax curvispinosus]|uniref:Uncharacterized protein LOC112456989 n=1 Tax=Temnothorax curvispinosus TaxID=300111 RepID=A0A6J1Q3S4_9HYME|nr:uncharacterized protein LOC112456989 [Temnothorax curvispinosus]